MIKETDLGFHSFSGFDIFFGHFWHFGIMRLKSRHHERAKMPKPKHLWSLMMSTFESQDCKMPKMQKCKKKLKTKDAKATQVIPACGSEDAKMTS